MTGIEEILISAAIKGSAGRREFDEVKKEQEAKQVILSALDRETASSANKNRQ